MSFDAVDVIVAKRDGHRLTDAQIDWVVDAYTRGAVAEEQMSALTMAILLNGMDRAEIARWTAAMIASGERMDFSGLSRPTADKHSTGGVGDKITLPLAPLVAVFGVAVPQLSGRGLGHTGGTLDKLESIPGWRAALSNEEMMAQLDDVGAVICQAGSGLAPADRKLYSLRDVTGTVESIPMIAASIMSKKIAEGTGALVLDVKVGSGAFMKDLDRARELARTMVELGTDAGVQDRRAAHRHVHAARPDRGQRARGAGVGRGAGRWWPRRRGRADRGAGARDARRGRACRRDPAAALADGRAMDAWKRMIAAQGGDPDATLPVARETEQVLAEADGTRHRRSTPTRSASRRGGSVPDVPARRTRCRPGAGVELHARPGDIVRAGQPLLTLHTDTPERFARAREALVGGVVVAPAGTPVGVRPLVIDRIEA